MTILLFVLTAVLVGYVVYTFYSSNAGQASSNQPESKPSAVEKPAPAKKPEPKEKKKTAVPAVKPPAAQPESADTSEPGPTLYRNPASGDTAAVPTNYRFAKRWIKEALVTEGLLDRVYKNNELDDKASEKVKAALDKFKEITKYHA
jgi:outer membrane biosynthesis protein TonB